MNPRRLRALGAAALAPHVLANLGLGMELLFPTAGIPQQPLPGSTTLIGVGLLFQGFTHLLPVPRAVPRAALLLPLLLGLIWMSTTVFVSGRLMMADTPWLGPELQLRFLGMNGLHGTFLLLGAALTVVSAQRISWALALVALATVTVSMAYWSLTVTTTKLTWGVYFVPDVRSIATLLVHLTWPGALLGNVLLLLAFRKPTAN